MTAPVSLARGKATLPPIEDRVLPAIGLLLLALLCFTGIDTCAKWLVLQGLPATEAAFVRYAVHLVIVCIVGLAGAEPIWRTANLGAVSIRALALLGSTILNFAALSFLPLTMTSAIMFSAPLWICLLSIPLLGETVGPRRWAAMAVGFCGILVVARPWSGDLHPAILLSLSAALCGALYSILTRRLAGRDTTNTQQFYAGLVATVCVAPFALGEWSWPSGTAGWLAFSAIGAFGWAGHQFVTIAHRFAPASTLAPFNYAQIVYMTASSWLIFAQPPDRWVIVGAGIVAASGLYIGLRERARARGEGTTP
jgi:drug/metabolite transporter (DMT)-like permease